MARYVIAAMLAFAICSNAARSAPSGGRQFIVAAVPANVDLQLFATEAAAQRHCPRDEVVWLNTNTGIYHEKGMRWYGNTRQGAYVCRKEADAAGDRDTRNGQ